MFVRIKSLLIFFLCLFKSFSLGKANKKIKDPKRVVIIQNARLGDMICATSMFRAIKEKYPQCEVLVIGNAINKELLEGNPDVDKYFVYKNNFWQLIKELKKAKIDFACDTNPNFLNLAMLYLAGIPLISVSIIRNGFCAVETKLYRMLRKFAVAVPHNMGNYVPREYLRLLEPIDIYSENTKKYLYFSEQADITIKKFFELNKIDIEKDFIVGISPSAGNKIKLWGGDKFAKLADYICQKHSAKVVIIGGVRDKKEGEEMVSFLASDAKTINTLGLFNIDELKALISNFSLFISVDTGPIYIAEAFNVPTIDIVGPVAEKEQPPIGKFNKIVKVEDRKEPAIHIMNAKMYERKEARRQIEEISVDMVVEKFEELMEDLEK